MGAESGFLILNLQPTAYSLPKPSPRQQALFVAVRLSGGIMTRVGALSIFCALFATGCAPGDEAEDIVYPTSADPTGCILEQITSEPYDEFQFSGASPDGLWLSYAFNMGEAENPTQGAYLLNLRSGERRVLPDPINNSGSFSADGRFLVGAQNIENGRTEIYEIDLETEETKAIAAHQEWDYLPTYSLDGRHILFNSMREGGQADIYLYERAPETLERLTDYGGYDAHAQFAPQGTRILFHRMNGPRQGGGYDFDLISLDLVTRQETRLTSGPFEESYGAWSPDGRHIVFSSDFEEAPEKHNLYIILSPDGEIVDKLTDGDWKDSYAYWTPDGSYIYFNSDRGGNTDIFRLPMNGLACKKAGK